MYGRITPTGESSSFHSATWQAAHPMASKTLRPAAAADEAPRCRRRQVSDVRHEGPERLIGDLHPDTGPGEARGVAGGTVRRRQERTGHAHVFKQGVRDLRLDHRKFRPPAEPPGAVPTTPPGDSVAVPVVRIDQLPQRCVRYPLEKTGSRDLRSHPRREFHVRRQRAERRRADDRARRAQGPVHAGQLNVNHRICPERGSPLRNHARYRLVVELPSVLRSGAQSNHHARQRPVVRRRRAASAVPNMAARA